MINKESFVKIVDGLCDYWDRICIIYDALGITSDRNCLTDIFDITMSALCEDVELNIDDDIGPLLYYYAFECDWGRNAKAIEGRPTFGVEQAPLTSAGELYDYLMLDNSMYEYLHNNVIEE